MADIVLGIGTSHTPMLSIPGELWGPYAERDQQNRELAYAPSGQVLTYEQGVATRPPEIRDRPRDVETFKAQAAACQRGVEVLAKTLQQADPDITIIISDDQDEWFFEGNMPTFAVYWGDSVPLIPRSGNEGSKIQQMIMDGYGDVRMDVPVASNFGRYLIEYCMEHDFDVAHMRYVDEQYGGRIVRRYPTPEGELDLERETPPRTQGLPHGFAFVVKRLFENKPRPILPVFQNTCYPPNQPTSKRSFQLGATIAKAVREWDSPARVAIIGSGGLSHFVTDEELDRKVLAALGSKDAATLQSLPRHRLHSATSETLNWVALGGAMQETALNMELVEYVPVYRTPAGTGGGWAFTRWL